MRISKKIVLGLAAVVMTFSAAVFVPVGETSAVTKKAAKEKCEKYSGKFDGSKKKCTGMKGKVGGKTAERWCGDTENHKWNSDKKTCSWTKWTKDNENDQKADDTKVRESEVVGAGKVECENGVKTSIIGGGGCYTDDGDGSGVYELLLIILNILTAGVGVLGVLGLVISGITYLTARDNEQQVAKAKNRILQIVIGLAVYAVLYLGLQFIIPGGIFGN